jgi:integrase
VARTLNRLSARAAATIKEPGLHADGGGLYLRVNPPNDKGEAGAKRWVYVFHYRGKRKEMGLGSAATVLVKDAREARDAARKMLEAGLNPIDERERERLAREAQQDAVAVTFGSFADAWYEGRKADWTGESTRKRWLNIIKVHCALLRPLALDAIGTDEVERALKPIWEKLPETAPRVRGAIEDILDAARVKGYRSGENPARWKGHLKHVLSAPRKLTRGHHAALAYKDAPAFVAALRAETASSARLVEFTILTASRPSEPRLASWPEIDPKAKVWTVPAERMKLRRVHRVPLSDAAEAVLERMAEWTGRRGLIFPGAKEGAPFSNMAGERLLEKMGHPDITVHGFRSTFRDWAWETTDFPRELAEAALAHLAGDAVERAYRRGDALEKRRELMQGWADFLATRP